jgi:hypothetical protein
MKNVNLIDLKVSGIFGIVNQTSKSIYIGYSSNILLFVAGLYTQIIDGVFQYRNIDLSKSELEVLESGIDIETCKQHYQYWVDSYRSAGWKIINAGYKKPIKVEAKPFYRPGIVEVRLVNTRGKSDLVGVFEDITQATEFIDLYYGESNPYQYPVLATNFLTRKRVGPEYRIDGWRN